LGYKSTGSFPVGGGGQIRDVTESEEPHDQPPDDSDLARRPPGTSDAAVAAAGALSETLEIVEELRGHLYALHRLTGKADFKLDEAVRLLRDAGAHDLAGEVETELIGRNVLAGRWTFQVVEEYDDGYYACLRDLERRGRDQLVQGRRHVAEAELKARRRTPGQPGHEPEPADQEAPWA
jgi:hypothetical protein